MKGHKIERNCSSSCTYEVNHATRLLRHFQECCDCECAHSQEPLPRLCHFMDVGTSPVYFRRFLSSSHTTRDLAWRHCFCIFHCNVICSVTYLRISKEVAHHVKKWCKSHFRFDVQDSFVRQYLQTFRKDLVCHLRREDNLTISNSQ